MRVAPSEFDRFRLLAADALRFSPRTWFTAPIETATRFADWGIYEMLGRRMEDLPEELQHNQYCNALLAGRWAACGYPTVTLGHKTAAVFAATKMRPTDAQEFVRSPWPAFGIRLPSDLLWIEEDGALTPASFLIVTTLPPHQVPGAAEVEGERWWYKLIASSPFVDQQLALQRSLLDTAGSGIFDGVCLWGFNESTRHLATPDVEGEEGFREWNSLVKTKVDARSDQMARAIILGTCVYLSGDPRERAERQVADGVEVRERKSKVRAGDQLPQYTEYTITSSLKINLAPAIREYVTRGGKSPTVQTMVAGHWKRVAIGAGRAQRKLVHVAPYWRGDPDAPISTRIG